MDQAKFYLKQAVKYRFWIAIALANLLAIIAAFVGIGPVQAEAQKLTKSIDDAYKDVQKYSSPGVPNDQYKPIVDEKKAILSKDVNKTWEKLYARQAPLLTWPEIVNENFKEWGRKYPETVDKALVQKAINDYVLEYPNDVEQVYQIFRPFDPVSGKGVVLAPAKEDLLRPAVFDESKLPTLGKIWAAKERLWIQSTLLDVVATVNSKAKDWDGAIIKQINLLEVGNSLAQDQQSIAKGETLEEAPELYAPGEEQAADAASGAAGGGPAGMEGMAGMYMGAGGRGGAAAGDSNKVFYIKPATENNQYKILPVQMSVLCDQNRVQDFLVALENSPMSIQVMEIEVFKPAQRVAKPEKGMEQSNFSGYGGYAGGMGGMMGMDEMPGMGGRMGMGRGMPGMGGRMGMGGGMGMEGGMPGMMGGMGSGMSQVPKGKAADTKRKDNREEREKLAKKNQRQIQDPYYNIVEVVIYGRARFYNPPTKEEAPAESLAPDMSAETPAADGELPATAPADGAPAAEGTKPEGTPAPEATPAPEVAKPAEPGAEAPKAEAPKTEEPMAAEPKAEAPKPEEPKV